MSVNEVMFTMLYMNIFADMLMSVILVMYCVSGLHDAVSLQELPVL